MISLLIVLLIVPLIVPLIVLLILLIMSLLVILMLMLPDLMVLDYTSLVLLEVSARLPCLAQAAVAA